MPPFLGALSYKRRLIERHRQIERIQSGVDTGVSDAADAGIETFAFES